MKLFILTIALLLFPVAQVLAHEEGLEITNLAEAEWQGPVIAVIVIASAIIIARIIAKGRTDKLVK